MAYCLRSFVETLEQVLFPDKHHKKWVLDHNERPQIQSLFENATFLQDFLDKSSPQIQKKITSLEDQIMNVAQKAAETLETYITRRILSTPRGKNFKINPPDMGEVVQAFEEAKKEVIKIQGASQPSYHYVSPPVSSTRYPDSKNMVVGVEDDLKRLRSRLTSSRITGLDVIPIVGMGGMGKTTLARLLYDEYLSSNNPHFDRCAWVTVSQTYNLQQILKTILACVTRKPLEEISQQQTSDLITTLYQTLVGRRYLIVLDDIWSSKAWDDVQRAFARENQGSRVILTTRENSLVDYVKSNSHEMHLMNDDKSWELLKGKVFGEESCPRELVEVGKKIALKCGGLPLALQVIGGLLAHSQRRKDFWESVAVNISSLIATTDDHFAGILSLSFAQLPHYLKPCFLYMGVFPEDYEIPASRIIKLWVAEGFLYPVPDKSIEEAAEIHLNALVDRNLISVRTRKKNGKAKSYGIHDLLRDLCLRMARAKKFFDVKGSKNDILQEVVLCPRRVSVEEGGARYDYGSLKLTSLARSFLIICGQQSDRFVSCLSYKLSLLRVLDVVDSAEISDFPKRFRQLVNLRYLAMNDNLNSFIAIEDLSVFKNLQTLIVKCLVSLAILEHLPQLRHLEFLYLEDKDSIYSREISPLENLQRLSRVPLDILICLLEKIPNLRKLGIYTESIDHSVVDLTCLQKLESLTFYLYGDDNMLSSIIFPQSLKQLEVIGFTLTQTVDEIEFPPGLEVLKLNGCDFMDSTWEPTEGEFCQLQYLSIDFSNLENWLATEVHFPVLRHLVLDDVQCLSEIPCELGGIETLESIEIDGCKATLFDSARTILEEQLEFGNTLLQLRLGNPVGQGDDDDDDDDDDGDDDDEDEDE